MLYINDDVESIDLSEAIGRVSVQRREQVMGLRIERDRKLSVAAYLLLREALAMEYGITGAPEFGYYDGGKPFIEGRTDIFFSLSHCRNGAACAVGAEPVGVDIETIRPYRQELARRVLNDEELAAVEASGSPDVEFIKLWTMKESYLKMTGSGIRSDLRQVPLHRARFITTVNTVRCYVCTVCTGAAADVTDGAGNCKFE